MELVKELGEFPLVGCRFCWCAYESGLGVDQAGQGGSTSWQVCWVALGGVGVNRARPSKNYSMLACEGTQEGVWPMLDYANTPTGLHESHNEGRLGKGRLQQPTVRVGTGDGPGQARMQHSMASTKT